MVKWAFTNAYPAPIDHTLMQSASRFSWHIKSFRNSSKSLLQIGKIMFLLALGGKKELYNEMSDRSGIRLENWKYSNKIQAFGKIYSIYFNADNDAY